MSELGVKELVSDEALARHIIDRAPAIHTGTPEQVVTVPTTDFFAFDDARDHYGLRTDTPTAVPSPPGP
jgi:hypothetical protein